MNIIFVSSIKTKKAGPSVAAADGAGCMTDLNTAFTNHLMEMNT